MTHDESYIGLCVAAVVPVVLALIAATYGMLAAGAILACVVSAMFAAWKMAQKQKGELEE